MFALRISSSCMTLSEISGWNFKGLFFGVLSFPQASKLCQHLSLRGFIFMSFIQLRLNPLSLHFKSLSVEFQKLLIVHFILLLLLGFN
jgi:apolipoprotein N-acyltransferase